MGRWSLLLGLMIAAGALPGDGGSAAAAAPPLQPLVPRALDADALVDSEPAEVIATPPSGDQSLLVDLAMLAIGVGAVALFLQRRWHRLPEERRLPPPFPPLIAIAAIVGIFVLGNLCAYIALPFLGVSAEPGSSAGSALSIAQAVVVQATRYAGEALIVVPILIMLLRHERRERRDRALHHPPRPYHPRHQSHADHADHADHAPHAMPRHPLPQRRPIVFGLAALLLFWPMVWLTAGLAAWITRALGFETPMIAHGTLAQMVEGELDLHFWLMTLLIALAAPIAEEVMYRGLLQRSLRDLALGPWQAIICTSMIFAFVHLGVAEPHAIASLFILSLGFGWAYERSGSLLTPITMHAAFNLGNLALARIFT